MTAALFFECDERASALHELRGTLRGENDQRETVVLTLEAVFDGDAGHGCSSGRTGPGPYFAPATPQGGRQTRTLARPRRRRGRRRGPGAGRRRGRRRGRGRGRTRRGRGALRRRRACRVHRVELGHQVGAEVPFDLAANPFVERRPVIDALEGAVEDFVGRVEQPAVEGDREERAHQGLSSW